MTLKAYAKLDSSISGSSMRIILIFMLVGCALALRRVSPLERLVPKPLRNAPYPDSDDDDPRVPKKVALMERYVVQSLDHTNPQDDRTWYQRYLLADEFHTPGGPVFVLLGGPWKIDGELAVNGSMGLMGRDLGAVLIDLEHRFYGKSKPTENDILTQEDLSYLTIEQALLDIANFARTQKAKDPELYSGSWVLYGSGYGANLASWARAQYPDLFVGAYASCPRLWVRPSFNSYQETVDAAFEEAAPFCGLNITTGYEEMALIVAAGDVDTLTGRFSFCEDFIDTRDPVDVQNLYSIMTMTLGEDVENARVGNLTDNICYWMQSSWGGTAFERLSGIIYNKHWGTCFTSDYQQSLEYVKNSTFYDQEKMWMYQLCSELGQFPTTDTTIGSGFVPIDHFLIYCTTVFGLNLGDLEDSADRLNELYGGLTPKGTQVVYTIGELDPWHALGSHQGTPESPLIMIQGASHGLDLSGPGQNDTFFLQEARVQVADIIQSWL